MFRLIAILSFITLAALSAPAAKSACRLESATKSIFDRVQIYDREYIATREKLCSQNPGSFSAERQLLFPSDDPILFQMASAAAQIDDIVDLIWTDVSQGNDIESFQLGRQVLELADNFSERFSREKVDWVRKELFGYRYVTTGLCYPNIALGRVNPKFKGLPYCDENLSTASLVPIMRLVIMLSRGGMQNEKRLEEYWNMVVAHVEYLQTNHWIEFVPGYPATLEYVLFSAERETRRPMHNNGLSEYGRLLLLISEHYGMLGLTKKRDEYIGYAQDIVKFMHTTINNFEDHEGNYYCSWEYAAEDPSNRAEDAQHGTAVIKFLLAAEDAGIGFDPNLTKSLITSFADHGLSGQVCEPNNGAVCDRPLAYKDRIKPGNFPAVTLVSSICGFDLEAWRFDRHYIRYCSMKGEYICREGYYQ